MVGLTYIFFEAFVTTKRSPTAFGLGMTGLAFHFCQGRGGCIGTSDYASCQGRKASTRIMRHAKAEGRMASINFL